MCTGLYGVASARPQSDGSGAGRCGLARAAAAESKAASLGDALTANQEAAAATDEEEAKFQAEVQKQIEAKQTARRNRAAVLRGEITRQKTDGEALHDITTHHHEKDIVTENIRAGV